MNAILTQEFKALIQQKGLVDSGALLNSCVVNSRLQGSELFLDISGVDYLPYVIEAHNLIKEWEARPGVSGEIATLISPVINQMVHDSINGVFSDVTPRIFVLINGV